jgi:hypothetical protein
MSGVRERMIASKSRNGLSVSVTFVEAEVADGKFKVLKARGILGAFKEKGARLARPRGKLAQNAGEPPALRAHATCRFIKELIQSTRGSISPGGD